MLVGLGILAMVACGSAAPAATTDPYTLSFTNLVAGPGQLVPSPTIPFSFPKFDRSLGSLQRIDIGWAISGTVVGSASNAVNYFSFASPLTHWVFFDFEDLSDHVFIAEPTLSLTASIPARAQNLAVAFGPTFQSAFGSFGITSGDRRFDSWVNGPGSVDGTADVFFSNTAEGLNSELIFFPGSDSGFYSGTLSFAYTYLPVPEPCGLSIGAMGLLLVLAARRSRNGRS